MARSLDCIKTFRNSLVDFLQAANLDGIGDNVYAARIEKAWPEEEAFIVVGIPTVNFADNRTSPRFYLATADVQVDIFARAAYGTHESGFNYRTEADTMADFLDDTAQKVVELVEPCKNFKGPFSGIVKRCILKSFTNNLSEGEMMRGAMRVVFGVEFAVCVNASTPADEFLKAENVAKVGDGSANQQEFVTNMRP